MNNDRDLMQEALDALESLQAWPETPENFKRFRAIEALRARLSQPDVTETNFGKMPETINMENFVGSGKPLVPVAWKMKGVPAFATSRPNDTDSIKWDALYTTLPQREWVGLTDDEIVAVLANLQEMYNRPPTTDSRVIFARAIEAKLREKNA